MDRLILFICVCITMDTVLELNVKAKVKCDQTFRCLAPGWYLAQKMLGKKAAS